MNNKRLEVFLVHPGGPFFANKDLGVWSIPKGEIDEGEDLLLTARREFREETGMDIEGEFIELMPIKQKGGKTVYAWATEGDIIAEEIDSNLFELEWPPRSGRIQEFPEVDRGAWFDLDSAKQNINPRQTALLDELAAKLQKC